MLDVIKRLSDAHDSISAWATFVSLSDESTVERWRDDRRKAVERWTTAQSELSKSVALVSIVSGEETIGALNTIMRMLNEVFAAVVKRAGDTDAKFEDIKAAMEDAQMVIRRELSAPIVPTSQSARYSGI